MTCGSKETPQLSMRLTEKGDAITQYNLGVMYDRGDGLDQNYAEAVRYYTLAAEQGLAEAQYNLGLMYAHGKGVDKNYAEAVRYYTLAADQRHVKAQFNLGHLYITGKGVDKNYKNAAHYYTLAADQGYVEAQNNLGIIYEHGLGLDQNYAEAVRYYTLAADQGNSDTQLFLANLYKSVIPNHKAKALHIYLKMLQHEKHVDDATDAITQLACDKEFVANCCLGCAKEHKLKTCARCKVARFCSTECVKRSWQWHRPNCKTWENETAKDDSS